MFPCFVIRKRTFLPLSMYICNVHVCEKFIRKTPKKSKYQKYLQIRPSSPTCRFADTCAVHTVHIQCNIRIIWESQYEDLLKLSKKQQKCENENKHNQHGLRRKQKKHFYVTGIPFVFSFYLLVPVNFTLFSHAEFSICHC